ncbi:MAG TPA: hypothetical protein VGG72_27980 [Bryobacteraceae bacterium]|jgi:hypothetical protein
MPSATIRRRVRNLEATFAVALMPKYPPFTSDEIADMVRRVRADEPLTRVELHRVEKQSPIVDGEFIISWCRGTVWVKHYIGIDMNVI